MKLNYIEEQLEKQGLVVFSSLEFRRAASLSVASAKQLLIRYVKKGLLLKLKRRRGLYCFKKKPPHKWVLANRLVRPSYISFESALDHYGATPDSVYGSTSATPKITKRFVALDTEFTFHHIKKEAYSGYRSISIDGQSVFMAEPEKAIADILYFVHIGKRDLDDRIRWTRFNKKLILRYLILYKRSGLIDWASHVIPKKS